MGYDRNDRGYGRDQGYRPQPRDYERGRYGREDQGYRGNDRNERDRGYGRQPQGYDHEDRRFFDRAGDEVRSWFGDEEAERRRRYDERYDARDNDRSGADQDRGGYGRETSGRPMAYRDRGQELPSAGYGFNFRDSDRSQQRDRGHLHDESYRNWRDRQVEAFDSDYDEYRRENHSKFENEFHSWRSNRQTQRQSLGQVKEHQEVVGSDGQHVGTVDHVRGDRIQLAKNDQSAGGHHHTIPSSWISKVDDKVELSKTADEAKKAWKEEQDRDQNQNQGANRGSADQSDGPHVLNRSFSGTY